MSALTDMAETVRERMARDRHLAGLVRWFAIMGLGETPEWSLDGVTSEDTRRLAPQIADRDLARIAGYEPISRLGMGHGMVHDLRGVMTDQGQEGRGHRPLNHRAEDAGSDFPRRVRNGEAFLVGRLGCVEKPERRDQVLQGVQPRQVVGFGRNGRIVGQTHFNLSVVLQSGDDGESLGGAMPRPAMSASGVHVRAAEDCQ